MKMKAGEREVSHRESMPNRGRVVKKKINSLLVARGSFTAREENWHIFLFITPLSSHLLARCKRARSANTSSRTHSRAEGSAARLM